MEQSRLAGARGPIDREKFTALHLQIHASQRFHVHLADFIYFAKLLDPDNRSLTHTTGPRSDPCRRRASLGKARRAPRPTARSPPRPATRRDPPLVEMRPAR